MKKGPISMKTYSQMTPEERRTEYAGLQETFAALKAQGLQLNMARGKPGKAQLDLVSDIFGLMHDRKSTRLNSSHS